MSTRLQQAERAALEKRLAPSKHRQIIIEERNKEIGVLKDKLRMAMQAQREAVMIAKAMGRNDIAECIRIRCGIPKSSLPEIPPTMNVGGLSK